MSASVSDARLLALLDLSNLPSPSSGSLWDRIHVVFSFSDSLSKPCNTALYESADKVKHRVAKCIITSEPVTSGILRTGVCGARLWRQGHSAGINRVENYALGC